MFRSTLLLLALAAASAALADTPRLEPVGVQAHRSAGPRTDVSRVCPQYGQILQRELEHQLPAVERATSVRINFRIDGERIGGLGLSGVDPALRPPLRRALRAMQCRSDATGEQQYRFMLVMLPVDQGQQRLAIQEEGVQHLAAAR